MHGTVPTCMCTRVYTTTIFVREIYAPGSRPRTLSHVAPAALGAFRCLLDEDDHVPPAGPAAFLRGRALPEERCPPLPRVEARLHLARAQQTEQHLRNMCVLSRAFAARCHFLMFIVLFSLGVW